MSTLKNKINWMILVEVNGANPNGDPLNGGFPRTDSDGYGFLSDVCIKRKLRNRLQDMGETIYLKAGDRADDGYKSLKKRLEALPGFVENLDKPEKLHELLCKTYADVRAFGALVATKYKTKKEEKSVSLGIRGPLTVYRAKSVCPVMTTEMQITKSASMDESDKKGSDTMGKKGFVEHGLYVVCGSINARLGTKTGLTEKDVDNLKEALCTLFDNDASAARPEGSIEVARLYWWRSPQIDGVVRDSKVFDSIEITPKEDSDNLGHIDGYNIVEHPIEGLVGEVVEL